MGAASNTLQVATLEVGNPSHVHLVSRPAAGGRTSPTNTSGGEAGTWHKTPGEDDSRVEVTVTYTMPIFTAETRRTQSPVFTIMSLWMLCDSAEQYYNH